jgi:hypothetical protein
MKTAIALLVAVVVPFGLVVLAGVVANRLLAIYRQRRSHCARNGSPHDCALVRNATTT